MINQQWMRTGIYLLATACWSFSGAFERTATAQFHPEVPHYCDSCTCGSLLRCFMKDWRRNWRSDVRGRYNMGRLYGIYGPYAGQAPIPPFSYHPERYGQGNPVFGPVEPLPPVPPADEGEAIREPEEPADAAYASAHFVIRDVNPGARASADGFQLTARGNSAYHLSTRPSASDSNAREWAFDGGVKLSIAGAKRMTAEADRIIIRLPRDADVQFGGGTFSAAGSPQHILLMGNVRLTNDHGVMTANQMELTP